MSKEEIKKYPIGGYAPGFYGCICTTCKKEFTGDKRAVQCEPCAIKMTTPKEEISNEWSLEKAIEFAKNHFNGDYIDIKQKGLISYETVFKIIEVCVKTGYKFGSKSKQIYYEKINR